MYVKTDGKLVFSFLDRNQLVVLISIIYQLIHLFHYTCTSRRNWRPKFLQ